MNNVKFQCPRCNGKKITGKYKKTKRWSARDPYKSLSICEFCHGNGEVDWIHRIIGMGSITYEKKFDIWMTLYKTEKWLPKHLKKKRKNNNE